MTEEQADRIIALLEGVNFGLAFTLLMHLIFTAGIIGAIYDANKKR